MIKGVNRQMIEILDTGNPYFERALLVVQPNVETENDVLRREARDLLLNADHFSGLQRARRRSYLSHILLSLCSAALGAVIALAVQLIL